MVVALRAVRVLVPWGVFTEPQGGQADRAPFGEPFLFVPPTLQAAVNPCRI